MQWNVPPMAHDAWRRASPAAAPISRQVIPMEALGIELPLGPLRHSANRVELRDVGLFPPRPVRRRWESVGHSDVRPDADNENAPPSLGNSEVFGIQDIPPDAVTSQSETTHLVHEKGAVHSIGHAVDVFNHKGLRANVAQDSVEMPVEIVNRFLRIAFSALTVSLAWITTN